MLVRVNAWPLVKMVMRLHIYTTNPTRKYVVFDSRDSDAPFQQVACDADDAVLGRLYVLQTNAKQSVCWMPQGYFRARPANGVYALPIETLLNRNPSQPFTSVKVEMVQAPPGVKGTRGMRGLNPSQIDRDHINLTSGLDPLFPILDRTLLPRYETMGITMPGWFYYQNTHKQAFPPDVVQRLCELTCLHTTGQIDASHLQTLHESGTDRECLAWMQCYAQLLSNACTYRSDTRIVDTETMRRRMVESFDCLLATGSEDVVPSGDCDDLAYLVTVCWYSLCTNAFKEYPRIQHLAMSFINECVLVDFCQGQGDAHMSVINTQTSVDGVTQPKQLLSRPMCMDGINPMRSFVPESDVAQLDFLRVQFKQLPWVQQLDHCVDIVSTETSYDTQITTWVRMFHNKHTSGGRYVERVPYKNGVYGCPATEPLSRFAVEYYPQGESDGFWANERIVHPPVTLKVAKQPAVSVLCAYWNSNSTRYMNCLVVDTPNARSLIAANIESLQDIDVQSAKCYACAATSEIRYLLLRMTF